MMQLNIYRVVSPSTYLDLAITLIMNDLTRFPRLKLRHDCVWT